MTEADINPNCVETLTQDKATKDSLSNFIIHSFKQRRLAWHLQQLQPVPGPSEAD